MANETIGKLKHHCGTLADVRIDRGGKLYLMCPYCGQLKYNLAGGQDYILNEGRFYDASGNIKNSEEGSADSVNNNVVPIKSEKYETVILENTEEEAAENPVNVTEEKKPESVTDDNGIGSMVL